MLVHRNNPFHAALLAALLGLAAPALAAPDPAEGEPQGAESKTLYREGHDALARKDFDAAYASFRELEAELRRGKSGGVDGALYWQAYALSQSKRADEAAGLVARLEKQYPDSRWIDDARALRPGRGTAAPAGREREEEALMAVDALLVTGNAKAVPILQRVLGGDYSDKVKSRAIFVLSQIDPAAADDGLSRILGGNASVKLKSEAIRMIAAGGRRESLDRLLPLFRESTDRRIRSAVLEAWLIGNRGDLVRQAAESEPDPRVRRRAIETLGAMGDVEAIEALLPKLTDDDSQRAAMQAFGVAGAVDALARIARGNGSIELRAQAVQAMGISGGDKAGPLIVDFYRAGQPHELRHAAVQALMMTGDGKRLIELYRLEKEPAMKRELLQAITATGGDDAIELIDEMLK